jgi:F0F1-type ATP synthase assembly protein I
MDQKISKLDKWYRRKTLCIRASAWLVVLVLASCGNLSRQESSVAPGIIAMFFIPPCLLIFILFIYTEKRIRRLYAEIGSL